MCVYKFFSRKNFYTNTDTLTELLFLELEIGKRTETITWPVLPLHRTHCKYLMQFKSGESIIHFFILPIWNYKWKSRCGTRQVPLAKSKFGAALEIYARRIKRRVGRRNAAFRNYENYFSKLNLASEERPLQHRQLQSPPHKDTKLSIQKFRKCFVINTTRKISN